MDEDTKLWNKKANDVTIADTIKVGIAVTVITAVTKEAIELGVSGIKAGVNKFRRNREIRRIENSMSK